METAGEVASGKMATYERTCPQEYPSSRGGSGKNVYLYTPILRQLAVDEAITANDPVKIGL